VARADAPTAGARPTNDGSLKQPEVRERCFAFARNFTRTRERAHRRWERPRALPVWNSSRGAS